MLKYKNNVKELMKEREMSLNQLSEICERSINTIRTIKNNPSKNFNMDSAFELSQVLNCSIKDLIEDDIALVHFDKVYERQKDDPLFINQQIFNPKNMKYLKGLLSEVGVSCSISPYSYYKTVMVKNAQEKSPIIVDFNLRVTRTECTTLRIVDFFVQVNKFLVNEVVIKDAFIKTFEIYARKLNIEEITFDILADYEVRNDNLYDKETDLPSDFSYKLGTDPSLFVQNEFECIKNQFTSHQITWKKVLY
ncbi:helix-turn-helix domain-containing protein [Salipaludibacillus agaradhaerens]|uniref:helix-turn-helix domain-containing protein n=1 Tax=Salipaludibacillus agaradhaerens TaxID=76935 RepID=UPI0009989711|nr:helix-turn-helix transcriptional regulator [Salipaludibacillus agaradhaerens]